MINKDKIIENFGQAGRFSALMTIEFIKIFLYIMMVFGTICSGALLLAIFPEKFNLIWSSFLPVINILILIIQAFLVVTICLYTVLVALIILVPIIKARKLKLEANREKYLDDLAEKMNKRLRSKK
jgi:hypothetical protein